MSTLFHPLQVQTIEPDTPEAVIVTFAVPDALKTTFAFTQGQYLTLRASIDGVDLRRSYSICAGVDDGLLRVGVRKVRGGVFSNWVNTQLAVGDTLQVMPPDGRFFVPLQPTQRRHHLGIAGGSGITPILAIMKTVLAREPLSRFTLIYGNRQLNSTMFKEALEDLKNRYLHRLVLHHVFSAEHTDAPLNHGLMTRAKITEFLTHLIPATSIDHAYLCGPFQMNDEAEAALLEAGVPQERVHVERFGVPGAATQTVASPDAQVVPPVSTQIGNPVTSHVTLIRDGHKRDLSYGQDHTNILHCATVSGLELPFSCTSGVCGTCRAKVVEGSVHMLRNFALDKQEVANGFVLTCQAQPTAERVVLSFDDR